MILLYVITNLLDGLALGSYTTVSTDTLYVVTNLANKLPSLPYRTLTLLSPESICIDLGSPKTVNFVGLFNHNISTTPTTLQLCGGATAACADCTCDTDLKIAPADGCGEGCGVQPIANFRNTWSKVACGTTKYQYWKLIIDDTPVVAPLTCHEIGELVLGEYRSFPRGALDIPAASAWVRLSPGRADGPQFYMGKQKTHYGQDWTTYLSEAEHFDLTLTTQNDPCLVDEVHTFLKTVQQAGGKFVLIPDDTKPFCYYVSIENLQDYADRLIYGRTGELRQWRLKLKTLTEGVQLL